MNTTASAGSLHIQGLVKEYRPGVPVLKSIDLKIDGTGLTSIIGPSGTGKSTLIRCINRLVDPTAGAIWLDVGGQRLDMARLQGAALRHSRRHIGMVFQEYNLVERLTVMENLLTGRLGYLSAWKAWRRKFAPEDFERAYRLLDVVGLGSFANQRADALSGGQRQRVGIARALMQQPALLLADEPTSSLDPKTSVEIIQLLGDQGRERGIPVIVNIHDVELARRHSDRIVGMTGGHVVYDGPPAGLTDDHLQTIYGGQAWMQ
ncbi:phosphonate ABC transporter ATP-binding protein [Variovorax sp. UMC13]|uniref:phosphonate ABC transporter ATP-binding protein n=1 Tax=Variovorax sp. UMC13 TaxID=1862326 RepID=UPI0016049FA6|nr:phosphonate ABC transporter ATP-binding protein [Variovorax sp. UMC13]MBB1599868.1 phosphonate ABC transporter ATP-binding protein [Variovorax sp. UMC13]